MNCTVTLHSYFEIVLYSNCKVGISYGKTSRRIRGYNGLIYFTYTHIVKPLGLKQSPLKYIPQLSVLFAGRLYATNDSLASK